MKKWLSSFIFIFLFSFAHENQLPPEAQNPPPALKSLPPIIIQMLDDELACCIIEKYISKKSDESCCAKRKLEVQKLYNKVVPEKMSEADFIERIKEAIKKIALDEKSSSKNKKS